MKLNELPIWPRIFAANPLKRSARTPIGILRAVAAIGLKQKGPADVKCAGEWTNRLALVDLYYAGQSGLPDRTNRYGWQKVWVPRANRTWSPSRDERRAAKDPKFRRLMKARQARETRSREIGSHIGLMLAGVARYGTAMMSESAKGRRGWYCTQHAAAGVTWGEDGLYLHPIRAARARKIAPPVPAKLRDLAALNEPHPNGGFCCPVDGHPGFFAVFSPDGKCEKWVVSGYCHKGHLVPESVVRGTVTLAEITAQTNDETRRIMVESYGVERYLADTGAQPVHVDDWGTLYDLGTHRVVRMVNSTVEADGSAREYFRAVPRDCATAKAAIAWTYGLTEAEYQPEAMS